MRRQALKNTRNLLNNDKLNKLITCVKELNVKIVADSSLGGGFCIGHSYFCGLEQDKVNDQLLREIVEYELIPLLKEYWFDEGSKVKRVERKTAGVQFSDTDTKYLSHAGLRVSDPERAGVQKILPRNLLKTLRNCWRRFWKKVLPYSLRGA